jgi:hypothetical protein
MLRNKNIHLKNMKDYVNFIFEGSFIVELSI